ncbi:ATP-binding protein [Streptomyces sp. TLI_105]|uniref:ATP-binding protein n=1 Tax=Streptomyces sp. TLI_105 TaxID=1881019 RepID=UPI00089D95BA|nr:ATP-binding protein [Streptomyces sp. TLI_105]SEC23028.1 Anti-sigma regulatory factor (Ser/Thr protein kinase) [Streptomyces sp. TLI_105]
MPEATRPTAAGRAATGPPPAGPDTAGRPAPEPPAAGPGVEAAGPATSWRVRLPHTTAAVPIARALIRTALTDTAPEADERPDTDTAELLTAELVANAVEHTAGTGPIELVVELLPAPGGCQIEVHDSRPTRPGDLVDPDPAVGVDPWQEHGRGLLLLRALSSDCGHRPTAHGKAVWFTLPGIPAQRRRRAS